MLNRPKYILFILSIAFSALTLANVVLFYLHIEDQGIFVMTTIATCTLSTASMMYLFFHFKENYISKKEVEDENGDLDMKKLKLEIEKVQKEKALIQRKKKFEEVLATKVEQDDFGNFITTQTVKELDACQAAYFVTENRQGKDVLKLKASFAYHIPESQEVIFDFGEGLAGQVAMEGKLVNVKKIPDGYLSILSGLGKASPSNLVIVPFKSNGKVKAVLEIASFKEFDAEDEKFLNHISEIVN